MNEFTLVRHSAYSTGGSADFEDAVEACELTEQQRYTVQSAGGLLFPNREAALLGEAAANYPDGPSGAGPRVAGYFSTLRIHGAEIYVPRQPLS